MNKPTIPDVLPLVLKYLEANPVGGSLHIYLDDGNTHAHNIEYCLQGVRKVHDVEGEVLATLLLQMSRTQRERIYRLLHTPSRPSVPTK